MNPQINELTRREFISALTATTSLLALGLTSSVSTAETQLLQTRSKRVGISDAAYQKAWERAEALVKQMTLEEKNLFSHRKKATTQLIEFLKTKIG